MKKQIITLALCLFALSDIMAQAFLNDVMQASEYRRYSAYTSKDNPLTVANYPYKCGFTLSTGQHGLLAEGNPGYAVFNLNGEYEKMNTSLEEIKKGYKLLNGEEDDSWLIDSDDDGIRRSKRVHS